MIIKNLVHIKELKTITNKCYSLDFDGVMEYIDCTNNAAFNQDFNTPFSVSAWIKAETLPLGLGLVMSKFNLFPKGWQLRIVGGQIGLLLKHATSAGNQVLKAGTTVLNVGEWYHISATYDGSNTVAGVNLYVNGILETVSASSGGSVVGTFQTSDPLQIGGQSGFYFDGNIASARMWNTELTSVQIAAEYNGGQILSTAVQGVNLVLDTDINNATFGTEWEIPDLTGTTSGYESANMEIGDRIEDCPS